MRLTLRDNLPFVNLQAIYHWITSNGVPGT